MEPQDETSFGNTTHTLSLASKQYLEGKPGKSKEDEDIMVNWLIRKFKSKNKHKTFITDGQ